MNTLWAVQCTSYIIMGIGVKITQYANILLNIVGVGGADQFRGRGIFFLPSTIVYKVVFLVIHIFDLLSFLNT